MRETNKHYYWLDLLRFISAILVVVAHCRANFFEIFAHLDKSSQTLAGKAFYFLTSFSDDAVLLFFILSGFLVEGKILEKIINHQEVNAGKFALSRTTRIGLPLIAAIICIIIVNWIIGVNTNWCGIFCNLLSLQNIFSEYAAMGGPLWTMPYIIWSYVLFFSFILLSKPNPRYQTWGIFILSIVLCIFILSDGGESSYKFLLIILGVLAYFLSKQPLPKSFILISSLISLTAAVLTKFAKPSISREAFFITEQSVPLLQTIETLFLAVVVSQLIQITPKKKFYMWLDNKSQKLATFSYSLFLIHFQIIRLMAWGGFSKSSSININTIFFFLIEIIICMLGGYLFYLCVEKHTSKVRAIFENYFYKGHK